VALRLASEHGVELGARFRAAQKLGRPGPERTLSAAAEILKVLPEVHAWTGFLDEFVHVSGNQLHESRSGSRPRARGIVVPCSGFFA